MGRNLRSQVEYAIQKNLAIGQSKHSLKHKNMAYQNNKSGKIYSYSTLHARQDVSRNFVNFIKKNYGIKNAYELTSEHSQAFLNYVAERGATSATLQSYKSQLNSLEKNINSTFRSANINISGAIVPRGGGNAKIRCNPMTLEHLEIIETTYKENSSGYKALKIAQISGCRASEICNLQNRNIMIYGNEKAEIKIKNGKGGRDRTITVTDLKHIEILKEIKQNLSEGPLQRLCPLKPDSLERNLQRHMNKSFDKSGNSIKLYYKNQAFHSIRKCFAQNRYNINRNLGLSIKESLQSVSADLGHNRVDTDLMNRYVANQW